MDIIDRFNQRYKTNNVILFHVPKTAGSYVTKFLSMNGVDHLSLHMNSARISFSAIFLRKTMQDLTKKIIVTWRDPVEHIFSCFNFYQQYRDINPPDNLSSFINDKKYHNMQIGFLSRDKFLSGDIVNDNDMDLIKKLIIRPNTIFISTEHIGEGIKKLQKFLKMNDDLKLPPPIRFNFNKIPPALIPKYLKDEILSNNKLDMEIYNQIIKTYQNSSPYEDTIIHKVPFYFPYIWICKDNTCIDKHQSLLNEINKNIENILPCSIQLYTDKWFLEIQNYDHLKEDCLCVPLNYYNLLTYQTLLLDKILSPKYYEITRP